jgi:hypothetical protein
MKRYFVLFSLLLALALTACASTQSASQPAAATPTPGSLAAAPMAHAMHQSGMEASAGMTHTMPMTSSMPAGHAMHYPGMGAGAAMTHTMAMAGGMDHAAHMAQMTKDMEAMMQRMAAMHSSMAMTHTMPMTRTMSMAGAMGAMEMTHEQHMGRMMIMMGHMMQMMGEMHMTGGMSGMDHGSMGRGGMNHGSMGDSMCAMMGGEGCKMMEGMDHSGTGRDHGGMGSMGRGMCDMMGGEGCKMMGAMGGMSHGSMGASSPMTATPALTATVTAIEAVVAPLGTPDTRTSEAGGSKISVTPLNLADPQAVTLDFALALEGQEIDPSINLASLATLRFGTQQVNAAGWQPDTAVLSFPASDLAGVRTVTLMIRNLAGAPLRTFTWTLSR